MRTQHAALKRGRYRTGRTRWVLPVCLLLAALIAGGRYAYSRFMPRMALLTTQPRKAETQMTRTYTLQAGTWYALQLGAFEEEQSASTLAESFMGRGAGGYVLKKDGLFCVLAAAYDTREDALRVQENLRTWHQVETSVTGITWPEVALQISGTESRVQSICAAYDFLLSASGEWQRLSVELDNGSTDRAAAEEILSSHHETVRGLSDALIAAFGKKEERHQAAEDVIRLLSDVSDVLDGAMHASSAARFGAQVKLAQLTVIAGLHSHITDLSLSSP